MLLVVWAVSFGLNERGIVESKGESSPTSAGSQGPGAKRRQRKTRTETLLHEIMEHIDFYGVLRRPTLDGVRVLLLLLPLLEGKSSVPWLYSQSSQLTHLLRGAAAWAIGNIWSNLITSSSIMRSLGLNIPWFWGRGYPCTHLLVRLYSGRYNDWDPGWPVCPVRTSLFSEYHLSPVSLAYILFYHRNNEDLEAFQRTLPPPNFGVGSPSLPSPSSPPSSSNAAEFHLSESGQYIPRDITFHKAYIQLITAASTPLDLSNVCRRIHSVLTGIKASRRAEHHGLVDANGMRDIWRDLDRCWKEFESERRVPMEHGNVARRLEEDLYTSGWQVRLNSWFCEHVLIIIINRSLFSNAVSLLYSNILTTLTIISRQCYSRRA